MKGLFRLAAVVAVLVTFVIGPGQALADEQKAVLITGASTGIGRNMAETLAKEGFFVYAGARKDKDLAELSALENIMGVRLDVTKQDDIDAAVALIEAEGRGLWGLINNAGVAVFGPLSQTPDEDFHFVFNVNVAGVIRVTRAFAPMIVEQQGRIITTGSIAGILSNATTGVYSMSKHAVEAFTDSLAREFAETGVHVSIIEPGSYQSHIRRTTIARGMQKAAEGGVSYTDEQKAFMEQATERELSLPEPDDVSAAALHALSADTPKRRYMVVPNEEEAALTIGKAVEELVQLNEGQAYTYSRDELVEMLDAALGE